MQMKKIALVALLGATALLVGCPDSGEASTDDVCVRYYESLRTFSNRCLGYEEVEGSLDRFKIACQRTLDAPGASQAKSYVQTCAAALETGACESALSACEANVAGDLEDGTACGESIQCKSGYCKKENGSECGKCTARLPIGADCKDGGRCVFGADCAYSVTGGVSTQKCVAEKKLGAGEDCTPRPGESVECSAGLRCKRDGIGAGAKSICAAREPEGGVCQTIADCVFGLGCNGGKCGARPAVGAECGPADECAIGASCNVATKKCEKVVKVNTGESCDERHRCSTGNCEGEKVDSKPDGTTVATPGKCVAPLADGAACTKGSLPTDGPAPDCDAFADCVNGTCAIPDPASCK